MKANVIEIQQQANALLNKRAYVRQAARKLLDAINVELSEVESFDTQSLYYDIDSYDIAEKGAGYSEEMQYRLRLSFDNDARIDLTWRSEAGFDEATTNWKVTDFSTTRMKTIRTFAEKIGEALQYFESELMKQNSELIEIVKFLDDIIQKLSA